MLPLAIVGRARPLVAGARDVPRARRHGDQLPRRRLRVLASRGSATTSSATWSPRTTRSATRCASSARRSSSASCCSTRWCRTRRSRCCSCDAGGHVVYGNLAARKLLGDGRRLEGMRARRAARGRAGAAARGGRARRRRAVRRSSATTRRRSTTSRAAAFASTAAPHELFVLRHLTVELHRQEVRTWKKVIRVISHELNNSLAPIASLAHSGGELRRGAASTSSSTRCSRRSPSARAPRAVHPRLRAVREAAGAAARADRVARARRAAAQPDRVPASTARCPRRRRAFDRGAARAGAGQPAAQRARVGLAAGRRRSCACAASPTAVAIEVSDRGSGHERGRAVERAAAVLLDQARRHRPRPRARPRDRRGARRPRRAREPRRRRR